MPRRSHLQEQQPQNSHHDGKRAPTFAPPRLDCIRLTRASTARALAEARRARAYRTRRPAT